MILRLNVREYQRGNQQKDNPENTEGQLKKAYPEKLDTQDEETQSKNTTQYLLDTTNKHK